MLFVLITALDAWQNILQESANAGRFSAVLEEPDGFVRREHIRDIYHYLTAQQLLMMSTTLRELKETLREQKEMISEVRNDKSNNLLRTITGFVVGVAISAVVGGVFWFKRSSS